MSIEADTKDPILRQIIGWTFLGPCRLRCDKEYCTTYFEDSTLWRSRSGYSFKQKKKNSFHLSNSIKSKSKRKEFSLWICLNPINRSGFVVEERGGTSSEILNKKIIY